MAYIFQFSLYQLIVNIQNLFHDPKNSLEELSGMSSSKELIPGVYQQTHKIVDFPKNPIFQVSVAG